MAKKDLSAINTEKQNTGINEGENFAAIEKGKEVYREQPIASPEEQAQRAEEMKTQGRRGCKAVRINVAFSPKNHEFIKVMSAATGKTMTQFINYCVELYRVEHPAVYEQAKAVMSMMQDEDATSTNIK